MKSSITSKPENNPSGFSQYLFPLLTLLFGVGIAFAVGKFGGWTMAIVFGLAALIVTLSKPDFGLFIFLFVVYTNSSQAMIAYLGLPSIAQWIVPSMAGIIAIRYFLFRDEYRGWLFPLFLLGLYAFLSSLSLIYAPDYDTASQTLIAYIKDALIGIIVIFMAQRPASLKIAVWALLSAGLFMGTLALFQQFTGTFENPYWGYALILEDTNYGIRLGGPIGDPNFFAQIMVVLLPIAIDRVWNEKNNFLKILASWTFVVVFLTVVYTYSRGGFLAMIVALVFMGLLRQSRFPLFVLMAVFFIATFQFIPANYQDRVSSLLNIFPNSQTAGHVDDAVQGRSSENLVALYIVRDHPVLGVGIGNYNYYYQAYARKIGLERRIEDRSAHNLFLEVAAERGVLGFAVFGMIILFTLRQAFKAKKRFAQLGRGDFADMASAIGISLIAYLVASIFLHGAYPRYFWVLVGICWSIPQSAQFFSIQSQSKSKVFS